MDGSTGNGGPDRPRTRDGRPGPGGKSQSSKAPTHLGDEPRGARLLAPRTTQRVSRKAPDGGRPAERPAPGRPDFYLAAVLRGTPQAAPALSPGEWREFLGVLRPYGVHALLAYRLGAWPEGCRPPIGVEECRCRHTAGLRAYSGATGQHHYTSPGPQFNVHIPGNGRTGYAPVCPDRDSAIGSRCADTNRQEKPVYSNSQLKRDTEHGNAP